MCAVIILHQVAEVQTDEALSDLLVHRRRCELPVLPSTLLGRSIPPGPVIPAVGVGIVGDVEGVDWVHRPAVRVDGEELAVDGIAELPAIRHPVPVRVIVCRVTYSG